MHQTVFRSVRKSLRNKAYVILGGVGIALFCQLAQASPIDSLKIFRTYYLVEALTPQAHQFTVWVRDQASRASVGKENDKEAKDWVEYHYSIADLSAPSVSVVARNLPSDRGLVRYPPLLSLTGITSEQNAVLNDFFATQFPGRKVQVGYLGYFARFQIQEILPLGNCTLAGVTQNGLRAGILTDGTYRVFLDGQVRSEGLVSKSECLSTHLWINPGASFLDFSLPPAIEGSALLASKSEQRAEVHAAAFQDLMKAISLFPLNGLGDAQINDSAKKMQNSLSTLLERQGKEELPPGLEQSIELSISVYGRRFNEIGSLQAEEKLIFVIPVKDLFEGKVDLKGESTKTGFHFHLKSEGSGFDLQLKANVGDEEQAFSLTLGDGLDDRMVSSSGIRAVLRNLDYKMTPPLATTFKGNSRFSGFDFYLDHPITLRRLTGPMK